MIGWSEITLIDWGINIGLKSTIILLLVLGLARLLIHSTSKFRYSVWKGAFLILFFLPFIGLLPSITIVSTNHGDTAFQTIAELPIPYESVSQNTARINSNINGQALNEKESVSFGNLSFSESLFIILANI